MNRTARARPAPTANHLLRGLPPDVYDRILGSLEPVTLRAGHTVRDADNDPARFLFVASGLASLLYTTQDGHTAEVSSVGREGGLGLPLVLGRRSFPAKALVQVDGHAWALRADLFRREFARGGALQRNVLRYVQALMTQMTQTVVCNRHHAISQQFCRWLLLSLDRLPDGDLPMTQETIAHMLGVRRAGVTEAAAELQRAGAIVYQRGHIQVPDRDAIEGRACECYRVIREEYDQLRNGPTEYAAHGS